MKANRNFHAAKASSLVVQETRPLATCEEVTDGRPFRGDGRPTLSLDFCHQFPCQVSPDLVEINVIGPFIVQSEALMRASVVKNRQISFTAMELFRFILRPSCCPFRQSVF
jgi:hypothetical protein